MGAENPQQLNPCRFGDHINITKCALYIYFLSGCRSKVSRTIILDKHMWKCFDKNGGFLLIFLKNALFQFLFTDYLLGFV